MNDRHQETRWERVKANIKTIVGAIILALFIRIVLFEAFEIEGPSMEPTLLNGDRVVVAKFLYGLFLPYTNEAVVSWGMPEPGDIVIVKSPADNIDIVKRVVGVPGDNIAIRDNVVWRNGKPLPTDTLGPCDHDRISSYGMPSMPCIRVQEQLVDHEYVTSRSPSASATESEVYVPEGHIFILGDHRDRSNDSRNQQIGPVPVERIKGRALFIYWSSYEGVRWGRIGNSVH